MRKTYLLLITLLAALPFIASAQNKMPSDSEKEIMAAKQVLMRVVGMKSSSFQFEKIPSDKGLDVYEVIAVGGKVQVKGSSTIAMTRGAYDYMNKACNVQYTWSSQQVTLPQVLPDYTIVRTVSPYKFRQYYNVCTAGYSTAFWKFADWEKELDWMALHGINMPLAMGGQEAIWQKVYKAMGMTNEELAAFFTGPAFLPWQRMGNVYKHDGPLPQSYIDKSMELQKQVLVRMKQLGMQPIVPGFSGIVPAAYSRVNAATPLREMKGWCDFPVDYKSYILAPGTTDFVTLGKNFVTEYRKAYGDVHYYMADLFNENEVPVSAANRDSELATYGKSVSDAITAGDPEGVWVMQGWLFYNNEKFWDKNAVKSFLSEVPDDKMLIIDLANESFAGWKKHEGFYGKPWIYSTINNYGGNSQLGANLPFLATDPAAMLASANKGNITGFGFSPEGIENNEVVYELLTQMAWTTKAINIKTYFQDFTRQRYGKTDTDINEAWLSLLGSVYGNNNGHPLNLYQARPPYHANVNMKNDAGFDQAAEKFIACVEKYGASLLFKTDLALVVTQYAGNKVDLLLQRAMDLQKQGLAVESKRSFDRAFELMVIMDGLTSTMPDQRLERMIEDARAYGNKDEAAYYEADAKRQVTQWGTSNTPVLNEYASKVWSGLIRGYYLGRWSAYATSLQNGETLNLNEWEFNWINKTGALTKAPTTGDANKYAVSLYKAVNEYLNENVPQVKILLAYAGNNKARVTLLPLGDSLAINYSVNGSNPSSGGSIYGQPFEVSLPVTIKALAYHKNTITGDVAMIHIPVSFGKTVSVYPLPSEKHKARFGATLTDGIKASDKFNDDNWLGYEGDNLSALISLDGKFKISKISFSYLENGDNLIFAPHSVIVETSADGINYRTVGVHDFDDSKWNMAAKKGELTIRFPETEASHVRLLFFNRGQCPEILSGTGQKAWLFVDEITVE
jgi:alpha-N-acetylglucosaminidase